MTRTTSEKVYNLILDPNQINKDSANYLETTVTALVDVFGYDRDLVSQAPLIPKLRGHFAEFLDNASSAGLRILSSSTCVGLRYGHMVHNSGFSRQPESHTSLLMFGPRHRFGL